MNLVSSQLQVKNIVIDSLQQYNTKNGTNYEVPVIKFSNRLTKTAGKCTTTRSTKKGVLTFSNQLLQQHPTTFLTTTPKHELGHYIAFMKYGHSCSHDHRWVTACREIGLVGDKCSQYHQMDLTPKQSPQQRALDTDWIGKSCGKFTVIATDNSRRKYKITAVDNHTNRTVVMTPQHAKYLMERHG